MSALIPFFVRVSLKSPLLYRGIVSEASALAVVTGGYTYYFFEDHEEALVVIEACKLCDFVHFFVGRCD